MHTLIASQLACSWALGMRLACSVSLLMLSEYFTVNEMVNCLAVSDRHKVTRYRLENTDYLYNLILYIFQLMPDYH